MNKNEKETKAIEAAKNILGECGYYYVEHIGRWVHTRPTNVSEELSYVAHQLVQELNSPYWHDRRVMYLVYQLLDEADYVQIGNDWVPRT